MSPTPQRPFHPAAGRDIFLPLYDPLTRVFGFDSIREALLAQAHVEPRHRILDIGCGTGTLAAALRQRHPDAEVCGLDPEQR